jgi:hypothetical protein
MIPNAIQALRSDTSPEMKKILDPFVEKVFRQDQTASFLNTLLEALTTRFVMDAQLH